MPVGRDEIGGKSLLLYDGVCGLCNRLVRFVLRRDKREHFRFLSLQDPLAAVILARHGIDGSSLNTVCLVTCYQTQDEKILLRSDAALGVLVELGGPLSVPGYVLRRVPRAVRDAGYKLVARFRYRVFGRLAACPLPPAGEGWRFLRSP